MFASLFVCAILGLMSFGAIMGQQTVMLGQPCVAPNRCADPLADCNQICRCRVGTIQTVNGCQAQVYRTTLNSACQTDAECAIPFAYCGNNKKCQCRNKYTKESDYACKPANYFCPFSTWFNDPVKVNLKPLECMSYPVQPVMQSPVLNDAVVPTDPQVQPTQPQVQPTQPAQPVDTVIEVKNGAHSLRKRQANAMTLACPRLYMDNCPDGSYCNPLQPVESTPTGQPRKGVCCLKHKPMCPSGEPLSTAPSEDCSLCPQDTHYCHCDKMTNIAACCPRPCPTNMMYMNSRCVANAGGQQGGNPTVVVNQPNTCTWNTDCNQGQGATCGTVGQNQKQCVCPNGQNYINGVCTFSMCANGQPLVNNGVYQQCSMTLPCPNGYLCDTQRHVCCPATQNPQGGGGGGAQQCPVGQAFAGQFCGAGNTACPQGSVCTGQICCKQAFRKTKH